MSSNEILSRQITLHDFTHDIILSIVCSCSITSGNQQTHKQQWDNNAKERNRIAKPKNFLPYLAQFIFDMKINKLFHFYNYTTFNTNSILLWSWIIMPPWYLCSKQKRSDQLIMRFRISMSISIKLSLDMPHHSPHKCILWIILKVKLTMIRPKMIW